MLIRSVKTKERILEESSGGVKDLFDRFFVGQKPLVVGHLDPTIGTGSFRDHPLMDAAGWLAQPSAQFGG